MQGWLVVVKEGWQNRKQGSARVYVCVWRRGGGGGGGGMDACRRVHKYKYPPFFFFFFFFLRLPHCSSTSTYTHSLALHVVYADASNSFQ